MGMNANIKSIEFTQEGKSVIFQAAEGSSGWAIADEHFKGCCEHEASASSVIVPTQSLQEMGFTLAMSQANSAPQQIG